MVSLKYLAPLLIYLMGVFSSDLDDPCGGSHPVMGTEGHGSNIDFSTALTEVRNAAIVAMERTGLLMRKYNNISDLHIRISNKTVDALTNVHMPNPAYTRQQLNTVNETLQQDYFHLSVIVVFMETVLKEEKSSGNDLIIEMMNRFKASVLNTLCKIKIASAGIDLIAADDSRMPSDQKNIIFTSPRYRRDYVIIRDAEVYLQALSSGYSR